MILSWAVCSVVAVRVDKIKKVIQRKLCELWYQYASPGTSLIAQLVKNLPAMQDTWVQSLGLEDALEKELATCSSNLA